MHAEMAPVPVYVQQMSSGLSSPWYYKLVTSLTPKLIHLCDSWQIRHKHQTQYNENW